MMNYLNDIETLKFLMKGVHEDLVHLNYDNFDENFSLILNKAKKAKRLREIIVKNCPPDLLEKKEKELLFLTKQIKITYDNLVKKYQDESASTLNDLKVLVNSKKIATYNR
ncbi:MAG: hypothetical protein KKA84_14995 [Bacteroidetes bacterium]|nr:hypothetical protein [Bacteroidota bacterium]